MNRYGQKLGFHTPIMTEQNKFNIEAETGIKFLDSSWHNDLCDSIANEDLNIQIFLPNSDVEDLNNEQFNTYTIVSFDGQVQHEEKQYTFEEIVDIINKLK